MVCDFPVSPRHKATLPPLHRQHSGGCCDPLFLQLGGCWGLLMEQGLRRGIQAPVHSVVWGFYFLGVVVFFCNKAFCWCCALVDVVAGCRMVHPGRTYLVGWLLRLHIGPRSFSRGQVPLFDQI